MMQMDLLIAYRLSRIVAFRMRSIWLLRRALILSNPPILTCIRRKLCEFNSCQELVNLTFTGRYIIHFRRTIAGLNLLVFCFLEAVWFSWKIILTLSQSCLLFHRQKRCINSGSSPLSQDGKEIRLPSNPLCPDEALIFA